MASTGCAVLGGGSTPGFGDGNPGGPGAVDVDLDTALTAELTLPQAGVAQRGFTNVLVSYGNGNPVTDSPGTLTAGPVSDSTGPYYRYRTIGGATDHGGWFTTSNLHWTVNNAQPDMVWVIKTGDQLADADVQDVRIWCLVTSDIYPSGVINTDTPTNAIGFRYSTPAGDTNWMTVTSDVAANQEVIDSGIPVVGNTRYVLRAQMIGTTSVTFSITSNAILDAPNDIVSVHTVEMPAIGTGLTAMFGVVAQVAAEKRIMFRNFCMRSL